MVAVVAPAPYAKALAASLVADMARAPSLERVVKEERIGPGQLLAIIHRDLVRGLQGAPGPVLFPNMRALARDNFRIMQLQPAGLAQAEADVLTTILSSVVPALAGAVGTYFVARTRAKTAYQLQKLDLQKQQLALRSQEISAAADRAQAAIAQGGVTPAGASALASPPVGGYATVKLAEGGLPVWAVPGALAIIGTGLVLTGAI